jgi:HAD superfamily 5'-nucleotidase-like hydrolase
VAFQQLILPFDDAVTPGPARGIQRTRRIFVNRDLRLTGAAFIGFDMDYTLAIYDQPEMDHLSIQATANKMVSRRGYPEHVLDIAFDTQFPIRGLLIDKRFGHILKMDRYKGVQRGYHGMRQLTKDEIRTLYQSKKIRPTTSRYHWIDTLYALSEAALYAGIVDSFEKRGLAVDYGRLFTDIRECIDEAHGDGTILDAVLSDLPRFVVKDPDLAPTLHKFRSAGRKLFLLTNSRWPYTDKMMNYLLGGSMPEYPTWRHFFDVVIVAAQKPAFFQQRRPLEERVGDELRPATFPLERGKIYQGGNLHDLERGLGVTGDRIVYVGDHIYGDILRSKKESAWRTAMIIQEMEAEVIAHDACASDLRRNDELDEMRARLEDDLRYNQARYKDLSRQIEVHQAKGENGVTLTHLSAERTRVKRGVDRVRVLLREVEKESILLVDRIDKRFHPYWGSLLKEASEKSSFGDQVEEYACLYTSRVSNFLAYSPLQYFRSPRDLMPHEL